MKQIIDITRRLFIDAFNTYDDPSNNFSEDGLSILYDYLEDNDPNKCLEEGEEDDRFHYFSVSMICLRFSEYKNIAEFQARWGRSLLKENSLYRKIYNKAPPPDTLNEYKSIKDLEDIGHTIIRINDQAFIMLNRDRFETVGNK